MLEPPMGQADRVHRRSSRRAFLRLLRDPATIVPSIVLVAVVAAARARSDDAWMRELSNPSRDAFERDLAALALAEQAPEMGSAAIPQLLGILEGNSECLQPPARRALRRLPMMSR